MIKTKKTSVEDFQKMLGLLKYPIITDKATRLLSQNKYTFLVDRKANKFTIKKVIEYIFKVNITQINTLNTPRKKRTIGGFSGYKPKYKKAIITLKTGETINLFPDI